MKKMKRRIRRSEQEYSIDCCALCKLNENCPDKYGEKITLKSHELTVHYFCLLMSSGVYQRGEENEGIYGFLVDDIKQEVSRSHRLKCAVCKKNGASVGCYVKSCRKMVHFPCGKQHQFIFQFTDPFPSYCKDHSPTQSVPVSSCVSEPLTCSVCLDVVEPVLSYSVLKCPACHGSWFHRDCVQNQAHSAGMFFFRCTLCNNKDMFQQEMLRMGIHIPERDAAWELEENAYEELLQVYQHCDANKCLSHSGRTCSSRTGWFQILRCMLCGSRGTHRKCASLNAFETDWACEDCAAVVDGTASLPRHTDSPQPPGQRRSMSSKRSLILTPCQSPIVCKRPLLSGGSAKEILQELASQISQHHPPMPVVVSGNKVLEAAMELVKRSDFKPSHALAVRFTSSKHIPSLGTCPGNTRRFLSLLVQQLQNTIFEGPDGAKNLTLDAQALREDVYFDVGCLLSLSLIHGGPPLGFFSRALYMRLFNFPWDTPLTVEDMGNTGFTDKVKKIQESKSLEELRVSMQSASEYLEVAGCMRPVDSLSEKDTLVEDIVSFHLITRMQLPFQRFREGLKTLGVFDQVQMFPGAFVGLFCSSPDKLTAETMAALFTVKFSEQEETTGKESAVLTFWRHYLVECEVGRCATSLEDVLIYATSADVVPAVGFSPNPTLSFLNPLDPAGAFPKSQPSSNHLLLPVVPSYQVFKKNMEYAVCQLTVMQAI
ncbi:G2/M phase-specific E3 ubiquitin-protein ligase [Coregonus clupeaformis]|uniref:G2/M phase-specific E3 ubiquitin-protein ligase n=1 Tax=Coregonus clupeaformis TaxID=59861 RepID=UPI001BDFF599|nr:G2/M phase-specific E3 ubiquitin-protein ligase [Coregonus clupeaformis]XP_041703983.1 G2/M phase-specific E3 ubiquitin-protein ligase [Coregonus clupeaformis]